MSAAPAGMPSLAAALRTQRTRRPPGLAVWQRCACRARGEHDGGELFGGNERRGGSPAPATRAGHRHRTGSSGSSISQSLASVRQNASGANCASCRTTSAVCVEGRRLARPLIRQAASPTVNRYRSTQALSTWRPAGRRAARRLASAEELARGDRAAAADRPRPPRRCDAITVARALPSARYRLAKKTRMVAQIPRRSVCGRTRPRTTYSAANIGDDQRNRREIDERRPDGPRHGHVQHRDGRRHERKEQRPGEGHSSAIADLRRVEGAVEPISQPRA